MQRASRLAGLLALAVGLACAGGCGDATGKVPVSGSVTFKGQPLDEGVIEFVPAGELPAGVPYTKSGADVRNGKYSIPRAHGLVPGKYKVLISSGIKQEATGDEAPAPVGGGKEAFLDKLDKIPQEWNVNSKQVVEAKQEGPNAFNFAIP
jgi:hypothetical protein